MFCYFPAEPGSQQVAVITAASMREDHDEHAATNTISKLSRSARRRELGADSVDKVMRRP